MDLIDRLEEEGRMEKKFTMNKKKYIFFDIDGTLRAGTHDRSYVPASTRLALEKLSEAGHFLCIATGRSQAMAYSYMEELGFDNMVSDGGYGITINKELLGIKPLNREDVIDLIMECERKGMPWGIQTDNSTVRQTPDSRFEEFTKDRYMKSRVVAGLNPSDYPVIYKAYIACYEPEEYGLESLQRLPWCRYDKEYIFVEPTDKAHGIRQILSHFGAEVSDVIVFGDAHNDLSMFCEEWTNVAMGNAVPELKAKADLITDDVDKDGIFNACLKLGLFDQ